MIINDSLITIKYGELIYLKVKDPRNNRFYGSTTPFKEMEVVNKISELKDYFERLTIPSEITANLTEISYNEIDVLKENMKTNTEYKLLKHEDLYYYNLEKEDQVLLSSIPSDNKKDAYKNMKDLVESFRDSNILIDKIKDEYYFSIFDYKTKNIIYYSFSFKSIEEVKAFIELISYNIPKK